MYPRTFPDLHQLRPHVSIICKFRNIFAVTFARLSSWKILSKSVHVRKPLDNLARTHAQTNRDKNINLLRSTRDVMKSLCAESLFTGREKKLRTRCCYGSLARIKCQQHSRTASSPPIDRPIDVYRKTHRYGYIAKHKYAGGISRANATYRLHVGRNPEHTSFGNRWCDSSLTSAAGASWRCVLKVKRSRGSKTIYRPYLRQRQIASCTGNRLYAKKVAEDLPIPRRGSRTICSLAFPHSSARTRIVRTIGINTKASNNDLLSDTDRNNIQPLKAFTEQYIILSRNQKFEA